MKKFILPAALLVLPFFVKAQTSSVISTDTVISRSDIRYCIIKIHGGIFSSTLTVDIDNGQDPSADKRLRDGNRKEIRFNSLADILNYMAENGWEYVNTIKTSNRDDPDYLMKRTNKYK